MYYYIFQFTTKASFLFICLLLKLIKLPGSPHQQNTSRSITSGPDDDRPGPGYTPLHLSLIQQSIPALAYAQPTLAPTPRLVVHTSDKKTMFTGEFVVLGAIAAAMLAASTIFTAVLCRATKIRRKMSRITSSSSWEPVCAYDHNTIIATIQ